MEIRSMTVFHEKRINNRLDDVHQTVRRELYTMKTQEQPQLDRTSHPSFFPNEDSRSSLHAFHRHTHFGK